jgi:hypothetical protein
MSRHRHQIFWGWCPYPKKPKSNTLKLSLPLIACILVEVIVLANFSLYYNVGTLSDQGTVFQGFSARGGSMFLGWDSTMEVPEVNSVVPASDLTIEYQKNQTEGIAVKYIGTHRPNNADGSMNITIVNFGQSEVHLASIKLYENGSLLWSQDILKAIPASSATTISLTLPRTLSVQTDVQQQPPLDVQVLDNPADLLQNIKISQTPVEDPPHQVLVVETAEGYSARVFCSF